MSRCGRVRRKTALGRPDSGASLGQDLVHNINLTKNAKIPVEFAHSRSQKHLCQGTTMIK